METPEQAGASAEQQLERVESTGRDHSILMGAARNLTKKSVAALVVVTDDGDGAQHEVFFYGLGEGNVEGYKKLGVLMAGVTLIQSDFFD